MKTYRGYTNEDYATDYAHYYNEIISALPLSVRQALAQSPFPSGSIPAFSDIGAMQKSGYADIESGYTLESDGSAHIAVLTVMPNVRPEMWDWWFGWHGCRANRYKLWHPTSHIDARWKDGHDDIAYIGRTSVIAEYIGNTLEKASIHFKPPSEFEFSDDEENQKQNVVYICARIGHASLPVDIGWLLHQVRAVEGGSEMRSRFWLGGKYVQLQTEGLLSALITRFLQKTQPISKQRASDILSHCAEEMNHLASLLPELYSQIHLKVTK